MSGDERLTATPAGVTLCALDDVPQAGARGFVLQMRAGRFHGFVVRHEGGVSGFVDRCPHAGLPLARRLDAYLAPGGGAVACAWHGALFDPVDGGCLGGPCGGAGLTPWPVTVVDGRLLTA
ncbi:Rieske (2Fe-2S) protein [Sphingomonas sp.]|uniref:Rieske (2Fe-2S) protein n=1 Tax=Sphingomonas sp. TaxID=28214 RepID=UPI003AFF9D78